jgi:nicotinamidase/pyrazinamidase
VVVLEDCSTAASQEVHDRILGLYRRNPLYPLFRIMDSTDFKRELGGFKANG